MGTSVAYPSKTPTSKKLG